MVGITCVIIAFIVINTMITDISKKKELNKCNKIFNIYVIAFMIGIFTHMMVVYFDIVKLYNDKMKLSTIRMLSI